jgi:integrase
MAILAECPTCHRKRAVRHKTCLCGQSMDSAKKSRKVRYWVSYYLPSGKQRRELCDRKNPYSIDTAKAADGKRKAQKVENPSILERLPEEKMTFSDLSKWYLGLKSVKRLKTYDRVNLCLANFNKVFGNRMVGSVRPTDLEDYQLKRQDEGRAASTIDMELIWAKAMVSKAFDNDMASGRTLKAFRSCKKKLVKGTNARGRILTLSEFSRLRKEAAVHLKPILTFAIYTGARLGEIRALKWDHVDLESGFVRLPMDHTKEKKTKAIPINEHVRKVLDDLKPNVVTLSGKPQQPHVFTYRGKPIASRNGLKRSWANACEEAGIPCGRKTPNGITFHDLRRTVKTGMVAAGVSAVYRDVILGHSLTGMDVHYMAPSEADLQAAMAKYTAWVDSQLAIVDQTDDQVKKTGTTEPV